MTPESSALEVGTIVIGLFGGLALFLFGMEQMTGALKVVAGERMRAILGRLTTNRFSAAATGAFVTAVIQSSSVTTVLVVGFIVVGVLIWVGLIGYLAEFVRSVSPAFPDLEMKARLAAETPRQIANTLLFLPFTVQVARLVEWLVPKRAEPVPERARPLYLDEVYLETPALALDRLRLEIGHLGEIVLDLLRAASFGTFGRERTILAQSVRDVELLQREILSYARRLSQTEMSPASTQSLEDLLASTNQLHNITDTVGLNLGTLSRDWESRGLQASEETEAGFNELFSRVIESVALSVDALRDSDRDQADRVVELKGGITEDAARLEQRLAARLAVAEKDVAVYRLESEAIELLKRIYYFAKRIAKTVGRIADEPEA